MNKYDLIDKLIDDCKLHSFLAAKVELLKKELYERESGSYSFIEVITIKKIFGWDEKKYNIENHATVVDLEEKDE